MQNGAKSSAPLACVPTAISAAEREAHFALAKDLFGRLASARQPLRNGYAFEFDADALEVVARFIGNERKCCPFMTFDLRVSPESGPLSLCITGPEGTRAVLDAELNRTDGCSCCS